LAVAAQAAVAVPVSGNILSISGASAPDRTVFEALIDSTSGICDGASTINVYSNGTTSSDSVPKSYGNWLVTCTARDTTTFGAAVEIGISKTSQGSEYGVDPVATGVATFDLSGNTATVTGIATDTSCTGSKSVAADATVGITRSAFTFFYGCNTSTVVPQVGISDVEPALFSTPTAVRSNLTVSYGATVPFTMYVSKNFYRALQTAQGLSSLTVGASSGLCSADTAANQTDACTPNLSMAVVRAILSGSVSQVSKLFNGTTALTAPTGTAASGTAGDSLLVCRRYNGSGTQKSLERLVFNQGCKATPALTFTSDSSVVNASSQACLDVGCTWSSITPTGAGGVAEGYIFQGAATGDVESCMNWAAGSFADAVAGNGAAQLAGSVAAGNGIYAVGIAAADRAPNDTNTAAGKQYRYIKIDGVVPTVENVVAGKWQYTMENVVLTPVSGTTNYTNNYNIGVRPQLAAAVISQLRDPSKIVKTHATNGLGRIGISARPSSTVDPRGSDTASVRPVAPFIRAASGSANPPVNNCNENLISIGKAAKVN
jgi:hypothetical protein